MKWIKSKIANTGLKIRQPVNLAVVATFYKTTWAQNPAIYFSCGPEYGVYWMYDDEADRSVDVNMLQQIISKHLIKL